MTVETHLGRAMDRVDAERERVDALSDGLERFASRVADLSVGADSPDPRGGVIDGPGPDGHLTDGGVRLRSRSGAPDGCERVRDLFVADVLPHADADAPVRAMSEELGREVAMLVARGDSRHLSRPLIDAVTAASARRRRDVRTMQRALEREAAFLDDAASDLDPVVDWIVDADETPLTDLDFDALRERHEALATHRTGCRELAERRQRQLDATTARGQSAIAHRSLVESLYAGFAVSHPVLATAVRLDDLCRRCQRAVREHLVRRG